MSTIVDANGRRSRPPLVNRKSLGEQVDELVCEYADITNRIDMVIDAHISNVAHVCPGVPIGVLKQCEITARSNGFDYGRALEILRKRIEGA